ncbi:hypothetical protein K431DRAFT_297537 [Polychaeton citri CBS 116435]|uniref:Uncharacterized protein n=1 Tax=Polychaeton citri CBS 116435 TaxID=1314669 RepID=A0A9P4Q111_9PEZI|nr:hypothetical protein K431DRAFT_297537 [Polychaeton citri CBS 116435]
MPQELTAHMCRHRQLHTHRSTQSPNLGYNFRLTQLSTKMQKHQKFGLFNTKLPEATSQGTPSMRCATAAPTTRSFDRKTISNTTSNEGIYRSRPDSPLPLDMDFRDQDPKLSDFLVDEANFEAAGEVGPSTHEPVNDHIEAKSFFHIADREPTDPSSDKKTKNRQLASSQSPTRVGSSKADSIDRRIRQRTSELMKHREDEVAAFVCKIRRHAQDGTTQQARKTQTEAQPNEDAKEMTPATINKPTNKQPEKKGRPAVKASTRGSSVHRISAGRQDGADTETGLRRLDDLRRLRPREKILAPLASQRCHCAQPQKRDGKSKVLEVPTSKRVGKRKLQPSKADPSSSKVPKRQYRVILEDGLDPSEYHLPSPQANEEILRRHDPSYGPTVAVVGGYRSPAGERRSSRLVTIGGDS